MENRQRLLLIRSTTLVALAFSAALLMGYFRPHSLVCSFDSNCDEVLSSRFGTVAAVPLPIIGVLTFATIFICSFAADPRWLRLLRGLALAASAGGTALIVIQVFVLGHVCPYCLIVDSCAILLAYAAFGIKTDAPPAPSRRLRQAWSAGALAALTAGAVLGTAGSWRTNDDSSLPPQVAALWVSGKVNVVEVADFECDHCREMHGTLRQLIGEKDKRIHLVRIVAPLPKDKHPHARDAARAYLCARALGKGDEMAEKLFEARDLTPGTCERLAIEIGIPRDQYRAGLASAEIDREIDNNLAWVMPACSQGLPCVWVQERRFSGTQSSGAIRDAIVAAELRLATPAP